MQQRPKKICSQISIEVQESVASAVSMLFKQLIEVSAKRISGLVPE